MRKRLAWILTTGLLALGNGAGACPASADPAQALALLPCLADPDPHRRDELAFEQLSAWARAGQLPLATLQTMRQRLTQVLDGPPDAAGVHQPFAVLMLAEVARVDRLQPFLSEPERADLVDHAERFLAGVRDYRGFVPGEGWRHGVAHGADLALQLGLNPALTPAQAARLLAAVSRQVTADHRHAYRFGEGARLARAALALQLKLKPDAEAWSQWLAGLMQPLTQAKTWDETALTDSHNLSQFLWPLLAQTLDLTDAGLRERWLPALQTAVRRWP